MYSNKNYKKYKSGKAWQKRKSKVAEYNKEYNKKWREEHKEYFKKWREENKDRLDKWSKEYRPKYYQKNKEKLSQYGIEANKKRRNIVLQFYGGNPPKCACCGETTYEFLSIDHISGGGNKHRKEIVGIKKGRGFNMCHWLIKNNFPKGFQVLCHNCNMAKGFYGVCPHCKK